MLQGAVAGLVPVLVVDRLEVVQVQHQHRELAAGVGLQRHLAAQDGRQEAAVEQAGEGVAAGLQVADAFEQHPDQVADLRGPAADLVQQGAAFGGAAGSRQALAQGRVDALGQLADLAGLAGLAEAGHALVQEPQAELGAGDQQVLHRAGLVRGEGVEQGVLPGQQQGALALALGAHVLDQREQAEGAVQLAGGLARAGVGAGHRLQRQVHQAVQVQAGAQRQRGVGGGADHLVHVLLENARAAADQVDRDADAGVHLADVLVQAVQRFDIAGAGTGQLPQPALQRGFEPALDLVRVEEAVGARVLEQAAVEALRKRGSVGGHQVLDQPCDLVAGALQPAGPVGDQLGVGRRVCGGVWGRGSRHVGGTIHAQLSPVAEGLRDDAARRPAGDPCGGRDRWPRGRGGIPCRIKRRLE
ncbi:hypothetical protein L613_002600000020 [Pseudoxanthomonas taiwanensis J19]|uniref:Uncharacterized protein n=1 Tax=Pseudoxanthomonas taiwanensis J19 TaxID=935569 RepID=A0A562DLH9_9GAMM|nr:hypothetical protein L613_002600000020 [Pseudoxanthomonas taiwanensis J19]